jgi:hypothetical protein
VGGREAVTEFETPDARAAAMTDQELRDYAAHHISYELTMFYETAMGLKWRENLDNDFTLKNALIESFIVHARVLAHFLYQARSPKYPDDVVAEDYVKDVPTWRTARGSMSPELREIVRRAGKEIAHLTKGRRPPDDPEKVWIIEHVFLLLCEPLHVFMKHADHALLDASVPAFINNLPKPPDSSSRVSVYGEPPRPDEAGPRTSVSTP